MYQNLLSYQRELAQKYKYKKLPPELSEKVRQKYLDNLPPALLLDGDSAFAVRSHRGTLLATGYTRIVIGDYGAYLEIFPQQILKSNLVIKPGQEYRVYQFLNYSDLKFQWFTAMDTSYINIYLQKKPVEYADYLPEMYYISPYDISLVP